MCAELTFLAQWWSGDCEIAVELKVWSWCCMCRTNVPCSVVVRWLCEIAVELKVQSRCCVCRIHVPCSVVVRHGGTDLHGRWGSETSGQGARAGNDEPQVWHRLAYGLDPRWTIWDAGGRCGLKVILLLVGLDNPSGPELRPSWLYVHVKIGRGWGVNETCGVRTFIKNFFHVLCLFSIGSH